MKQNEQSIRPEELFAGTAEFYDRYRVPYPFPLYNDFRLLIPRKMNRLLDIGTGNGRLISPLIHNFSQIVCIDPDPSMLALAQKNLGNNGISYLEGTAQDSPLLKTQSPYDVITMGNVAHWIEDLPMVLQTVSPMVVDTGAVVIVDGGSLWETKYLGTKRPPWVNDIKKIHSDLIGERRGGSGKFTQPFSDTLLASPFSYVVGRRYVHSKFYTADEILGNLHSTSYGSKRALGDRYDIYEQRIRDFLKTYSSYPKYEGTNVYTALFAWKKKPDIDYSRYTLMPHRRPSRI